MAIHLWEVALYAPDVALILGLLATLVCCSDDDDDEPESQRQTQVERVTALRTVPPLVVQVPPPPQRATALPNLTTKTATTTTLPYFPYAQGRESEMLVCAICLEQLRHGELCSEVPACRHMFHRECVGSWMKKSNSCPLCRVKIVPGYARSNELPVADMV